MKLFPYYICPTAVDPWHTKQVMTSLLLGSVLSSILQTCTTAATINTDNKEHVMQYCIVGFICEVQFLQIIRFCSLAVIFAIIEFVIAT